MKKATFIGRSAKSGKFMKVSEAKKKKNISIVERIDRKKNRIIDYFTKEEQKVLHSIGVVDNGTIVEGVKKLIAEIKRLREEVTNK